MDTDFLHLTNVASTTLGTRVVYSTDDFFASCDRMLQTSEPLFVKDKYDEHGKWMDGWETRRRRDGKNDYCILKLARKSEISGFDVDTTHFTGNYAPAVHIEGVCLEPGISDRDCITGSDSFDWISLHLPTDLCGNSHNYLKASSRVAVTHLKITMLPDGGIARFRAYGSVCFDPSLFGKKDINLTSLSNGTRAIFANDEHFGRLENILADHKPINMADGWETRRRREPGNDWGIIALPAEARISQVEVDTSFFKGNFPESFSLCAAHVTESTDKALITQSMFWKELLSRHKLTADSSHRFPREQILMDSPVTHVRINIYPDGGIARLRMYGEFVQ